MKFLSDYLNWHYSDAWKKVFLIWKNLTLFPFYYFSVVLHLSTLFAPWKRQRMKMGIGFHLDQFLAVLGFNLIARVIGAIIRLTTISYGLLLMLGVFLFGGILALLWPFAVLITLPFYLIREIPDGQKMEILRQKCANSLTKLATLLFQSKEGQFIAYHLGIGQKELINSFASQGETLQAIPPVTTFPDLFKFLAENFPAFTNILERCHLKSEDVYETAKWYELLSKNKEKPLIFDLGKIKALPGVGHDWAYGYTVEFDKYAEDLTKKISPFPLLIGREKELSELERILLETQSNNALIVGIPGVARHRLVETLAHRILTGNCHKKLSHKRILNLNMHALVSGKPTLLETKGLVESILKEAEAGGNIIACIDEIDKYVATGGDRIDLTDVLTKFAESNVGLIGITTPEAYHKYIAPNENLSPLFEKIEILAPDKETVLSEMEISIVPVLEKKYQIIITYPAITKAIEDSDRFLSTTPFPAKTIELLDGAAVFLTNKKKEFVLKDTHIDEFLSEKLHMNVGKIEVAEKEKLVNLENLLHSRIINQDEAIRVISSALRRARLNVSSANRPVGSFLFLGPTGVGKTETAKALSAIYFGGEEAMLRFDMSQYQKEEGLERLIGSAKLNTFGEMTSKIADRPFSLLLFDEFEKADDTIDNLLLTLLDEGYITDATGQKVNARNTIIIATSNAGAEFIRERLQQGLQEDLLQKALLEHIQREKIFSPELLNRFDDVVVFTPLSEGQLKEVAKLQLFELNKRLAPKEMSVAVTADLIKKLAIEGFNPQFGARAMKRVIAEKIEDQIAKRLLAGSVKKGEEIQISL